MARIAFCGLGQMGAPMAARLLDAGHDVIVWNRTPSRVDPLVGRGARSADSPATAAGAADGVITMLSDPTALEEVALGPDGLAEGLEAGSVLIEMSTVGPDAVRDLARRLPEGVDVLDAPVRGSVQQAEDGELKIFVGGRQDVYRAWEEVLSVLGTPQHVGPLGTGAAMKLVANLTLGVAITGLGEALALADAMDLPWNQVMDMLADTPLGAIVPGVRPRLESGAFEPRFKLSLAEKDLRLVTEVCERAGLSSRVAASVREWFRHAAAAGLADRDYTAVAAHIAGRTAGLEG